MGHRMIGGSCRAILCAALHLTLSACGGDDDAFVPFAPFASEGAYVQNVSMTSATIGVLTTREEAFAVELYEATDEVSAGEPSVDPAQTVVEEVAQTIHELDLTDLAPDARYSYVVRDHAGNVVGQGIFSTAPVPGTRPISFAVLGDSGRADGTGLQGEVVRSILQHADLISSSTPETSSTPTVHAIDTVRLSSSRSRR